MARPHAADFVVTAGRIDVADLMTNSATAGAALTQILKRSRLNREQLAEVLSVSVDTVNNWCRNRSSMRLSQMVILLSTAIERGMAPAEVRQLAAELLTGSGLSQEAASKLLPPARSIQTKLVLFLAPESLTLGNRLLAAGAADFLRAMDVDMLLASTYGSVPDFGQRLADVILATRPVGIIVCGDIPSPLVRSVTDTAEERSIPLVFVQDFPRDWRDRPGVVAGQVGTSSFAMGLEAGRFLIRQGHRKIGYFGPSLKFRNFEDRFVGLKAALEEENLPFDRDHTFFMPLPGDKHILATIDNLSSWTVLAEEAVGALASGSVEALFVVSDPSSLAVYIALANHGMGLQETDPIVMVGVVGSDWPERIPGPRIAYIEVPLYQMGREAAKLIAIDLSRHDDAKSTIRLPLLPAFKVSKRGGAVISPRP